MTIKVEVTGAPDAQALAALHDRCFDKPWDKDAIGGMLAVAGTVAFVAFPSPSPDPSRTREGEDRPNQPSPRLRGESEGGSPVGFGLLRVVAGEAEILTLAVVPGHRKHGVGSAIVRAMLALAKERGAAALFLEVAQRNEAAQKLYEKQEFSVISHRKEYYRLPDGSYDHALVMRRIVAP